MNNNKELKLYKTIDTEKQQTEPDFITREAFEQFLQEFQQVKQRVHILEQKVQDLEQENQEFKRIQNIFQQEVEDMRVKNFHIHTKFAVIGIQNNWYDPNSSEYKEYSFEQIQMYNKKYHFNVNLFKSPVLQLEKKTQTQRLEILQDYFQKNPNNRLSITAVIDLLGVCRKTAKKDMLLLVKEHQQQYEIIQNPVIRKHKNQKSQTKKVFSIQRIGTSI